MSPLILDPRVPGWEVRNDRLQREITFANFSEAFGFMTRVAMAAEQLDHHPDWSNSWNRVTLEISNHAEGGITERCLVLASRVNEILGESDDRPGS